MEEIENTKGPSLEYFSVLQEFEDVFKEMRGFPSKRYSYFSIELVSRAPQYQRLFVQQALGTKIQRLYPCDKKSKAKTCKIYKEKLPIS